MYSLLKKLGAKNVTPYCPDRVKDGYGLQLKEAKWIVKDNYDLVITTDNGISSVDAVKYLKAHNVHVIISDHHNWQLNQDGSIKKSAIPNADAIIMPNCPFDKFHFDGFCGAGIAFMIACYMLKRVATEYLDLACLGTVADNVPLRDEDRVIVYYGLKEIQQGSRKGIVDLIVAKNLYHLKDYNNKQSSYQMQDNIQLVGHAKREAKMMLEDMTAKDLSFSVIPQLNSIGRLSNANLGRKLLLAKD